MRASLLIAFLLSFPSLTAPLRKPNCRLTAARTYSDGREESIFKEVFTKSDLDCQKLSEKGDFTENARTDMLRVHSAEEFNCQVSIWRQHKGGASELLEYLVRVDSSTDCKKRGRERHLTSEMKTEFEKKKRVP